MSIRHPHKVVVTSGATLVNQVVYPYPCTVHSIHVAHSTGGAAWLQIHNSATVPAEGAVPLITHSIDSASSDAAIEGGMFPFHFDAGVYVCESNTVPTKTLHTGEDLFVTMVIEVPSGEE